MVVKNYLYNLMYQIISIILPIITIPYVSRILGPSGLGEYALTSTYAQYFVLFGMIGLSMYCGREIAYVRDDKNKLSRTFWELNILRFITMGITIVIYLIMFCFVIKTSNRLLLIVQSTILFSCLFDISWLFVGIEDFKTVAIRNTVVKAIGVILIFLLIKKSNQVVLYAFILGITQLIGQIIMWFDIPKEIKFIKPINKNLIKHLKNSIGLFIPQIAITVYTMLDKVMLGLMTNDAQVGLYDNSQRIIKLSITIVTTLATVTVPKMANLYAKDNIEEFAKNAYKSFSFVSFLALPMAFGLIGVSETFVGWFFGPGFEEIKPMFYIGAWLMVTLSWSSIVGSQVLISIRREKMFTIAVVSGAILNVILNFILIKKFQGIGTTIASVAAEFLGMFIMVYFTKDILKIKKLFKSVPKYFIASLIMFIPIFILGKVLKVSIITTAIQVVVGVSVYIGIMIITKDKNLMFMFSYIEKFINKKR
ncbi:flippase [Clostridium sp. Ade.TY]|uniref:flippase n=1 Tax=Clostridium sp. Ade.TY TaxID=1391647 RepID=UPI0003FE0399|nr:flippase [Clostridium sp. Ade.TY]